MPAPLVLRGAVVVGLAYVVSGRKVEADKAADGPVVAPEKVELAETATRTPLPVRRQTK